MKELEFLKIINQTLSKNSHLGDDCAFLKDLGIVITHDSLVEDIHFCLKYSTPYQLGYKAISVNLSDIFASGAKPKYFTISLSLPPTADSTFVEKFYKACNDLAGKFNFEVVGGDITGSDKVFISICAIGITNDRKISSRSDAKIGDYIITTGVHGSSTAGLWLLQNPNKQKDCGLEHKEIESLVNTHLMPIPQENLSEEVSTTTDKNYAMMDTSDGLADALYKIGQASNVTMHIDLDKIPYDKNIKKVAKVANKNFKDWIFYGGEDFQLIACVNEKTLAKLDSSAHTIIGRVEKLDNNSFVKLNSDNQIEKLTLEKTYNHFKEVQ